MDHNYFLYALPALLALFAKGGIYLYAHYSPSHSLLTRLYLLFLFALSVQNLAEISHFMTWARGTIPSFELRMYYAASIIALAFLLHFALAVGLPRLDRPAIKTVYLGGYVAAAIMIALLFHTGLLIEGFTPFGYSLSRVPGPLYFLFEFYAIGIFISVIGLMIYGIRKQTTPRKRARSGIVLLAILPMAALIIMVLVFLHFDIKLFNATFTNPIAITYFLLLTAYAAHRYRFFDIQLYLPWSRTRNEKIRFYRNLRELGRSVETGSSAQQILTEFSRHMGCSVALFSNSNLLLATDGNDSGRLRKFPLNILRGVDKMVVTEELEDTAPDMQQVLHSYGVGAIVPIYPLSKRLPGWLLLDENFSKRVYTPRDFRIVRQLLDRVSGRFLDMMMMLRDQYDSGTHGLRRWVTQLNIDRDRLLEENQRLRNINAGLVRERSRGSLEPLKLADERDTVSRVAVINAAPELLARLKSLYQQVSGYDSVSGFIDAGNHADLVLVTASDSNALDSIYQINAALAAVQPDLAWIVTGPHAATVNRSLDSSARGKLLEFVPDELAPEVLADRCQALLRLKTAAYDLDRPDCPLLGNSTAFTGFMESADRCRRGSKPVFLRHQDRCQALAVAGWLHRGGDRHGELVLLPSQAGQAASNTASGLLQRAAGGTLVVDNIVAMPLGLQQVLLHTLTAMTGDLAPPRLVICCQLPDALNLENAPILPDILRQAEVLRLPSLKERHRDIPLLAHYFTLQYTINTGQCVQPGREFRDQVLKLSADTDLDGLYQLVDELLNRSRLPGDRTKNHP